MNACRVAATRLLCAAVLAAVAVAGEDSMLDAVALARSDELPTLKHLRNFISEPGAYTRRIELIDWSFHATYAEGADRATLTYQTYLLKRHAFSHYFQCSLAACANQWLRAVDGMLSKDADEAVASRLHVEAYAIAQIVPKAMAALRNMRYAAPRWMTMLLLLADDLAERLRPGATMNTFEKVKLYAPENALRTMAAARAFLDRCDRFLDVATSGPYTEHEHGAPAKDLAKLSRNMSELGEAFDASADALPHDGADAFAVRAGWLMDDVITDPSATFFLQPDVALGLGIDWKMAVTSRHMKVTDALKVLWGAERNARFESFDTGRMVTVQNFVRDAFRLVVLRFLHVGAAHCDHMYEQTDRLTPKQQKFVDLYGQLCGPIVTVAENASRYLGGDQVLDGLVPLLRAMVAVPNFDVSTVRMRTAALLDRMSGSMGVDALATVQPILENQLTLTNSRMDASNMFRWVRRHFEFAESYVANVRSKFPKLSFDAVAYLQMSFGNEWVYHSH